jgi:hypothetical protein
LQDRFLVGILFIACMLGSANSVKPTGASFEPDRARDALSVQQPRERRRGCGNTARARPASAVLTALGNASITDGMDTLQFQVVGENDHALTVILQASSTNTGAGYGAGVSSLVGPTLKLYFGHAGTGNRRARSRDRSSGSNPPCTRDPPRSGMRSPRDRRGTHGGLPRPAAMFLRTATTRTRP